MTKELALDMKTYENMFNDDGDNISGFTYYKIKEITVKAYIARDKQNNKFNSACEQFLQILKLKKHFLITDIRFEPIFRAKNMEEFYNLLTCEELDCLGW